MFWNELVCVLIATLVCGLAWLLRLAAPITADEGYLWYGVQQVLKGRWPHRDFKSYEPGRYGWTALVCRVAGRKLAAIRVSTHLFMAISLVFALFELSALGLGWPAIVAACCVLVAWAHPQHKQFEHGWILLAWAAISAFLREPDLPGAGIVGVTLGASLFFGFNLALYFLAACVLAGGIAVLEHGLQPSLAMLAMFSLAWLAGALPFLCMMLSRRFAQRFWERRIASVLTRGSANLPLPRPWPWRPPTATLAVLGGARARAFQALFLALLIVPFGYLAAFALGESADPLQSSGLLAAAALGLPIFHHAASRADPPHIAQSAGPLLLILCLALPTAALLLVAAFLVWMAAPFWRGAFWSFRLDVKATGVGSRRGLDTEQRQILDIAQQIKGGRSEGGPGPFAAPVLPWVYAALACDAPVYDTFCVHIADDVAQSAMIRELIDSGPPGALIDNVAVDGRDDLRFSHTHPRVWAFLHQQFARVERPFIGSELHVFLPMDGPAPSGAAAPSGADRDGATSRAGP